jgi:hypothetical protein
MGGWSLQNSVPLIGVSLPRCLFVTVREDNDDAALTADFDPLNLLSGLYRSLYRSGNIALFKRERGAGH